MVGGGGAGYAGVFWDGLVAIWVLLVSFCRSLKLLVFDLFCGLDWGAFRSYSSIMFAGVYFLRISFIDFTHPEAVTAHHARKKKGHHGSKTENR